MGRIEQALVVAKKISEMEAELGRLRAEFASYVGEGDVVTVFPRSNKAAPAPSRIVALLASNPGRVWTPPEVAAQLADLDIKLVRNTLLRLAKDGKIRNLSRGSYQAITKTLQDQKQD